MRKEVFNGVSNSGNHVKIMYDSWDEKYIVFGLGITVYDGSASKEYKEITSVSNYEESLNIAMEE